MWTIFVASWSDRNFCTTESFHPYGVYEEVLGEFWVINSSFRLIFKLDMMYLNWYKIDGFNWAVQYQVIFNFEKHRTKYAN